MDDITTYGHFDGAKKIRVLQMRTECVKTRRTTGFYLENRL
jgi:hypothetical protein